MNNVNRYANAFTKQQENFHYESEDDSFTKLFSSFNFNIAHCPARTERGLVLFIPLALGTFLWKIWELLLSLLSMDG